MPSFTLIKNGLTYCLQACDGAVCEGQLGEAAERSACRNVFAFVHTGTVNSFVYP